MRQATLPLLVLGVSAVLVLQTSCDQVMDLINAGAEESRQNEENRRKFKERQQARMQAKRRDFEPVKADTEKPALALDPSSPAGRLLAEIERRLECKDETCKARVLTDIRQASKILLPGLPKLLQGQTKKVTIEAIKLAGLFRHRDALPGIGRAATMGDRKVRTEAIWALGAMKDARAFEYLERLLEYDNPPWLMVELCRTTGQIGTARAMNMLNELYATGEVNTRFECVQAASRIQAPGIKKFLIRAKGDRSPKVAAMAEKALNELGQAGGDGVNDAPR